MGAVVIGNLYPNPSSAMEISYNSELSAWMNKSSVAFLSTPMFQYTNGVSVCVHPWGFKVKHLACTAQPGGVQKRVQVFTFDVVG